MKFTQDDHKFWHLDTHMPEDFRLSLYLGQFERRGNRAHFTRVDIPHRIFDETFAITNVEDLTRATPVTIWNNWGHSVNPRGMP